ncbi:hypothetical protein I5535_06410 [Rhodobacteraceae bacterium F11138]|nr:hypothetical protein [Rhodobacteraceae bacterium F11138]
MTLTVHPDPQHPAGGYAFLELPAGSLPGEHAKVAVFDAYGERWLAPGAQQDDRVGIGDPTWQSDRIDFGPYQVYRHDGADWVRVGPEIVNRLDEYMPLRIEVDGLAFDISWPDDVPPRAGAAVLGGLRPVARQTAEQAADRLVGRPSDDIPESPEPAATPAPMPPQPETPAPVAPAADPVKPRKRALPWLLAAVAVVLLAAVLWYVWPIVADDGISTPPRDDDETPLDGCTLAALSSVPGAFSATAAAIRDCGADVSADTALALIEDAAARGDGAALLLFGTLYDGRRLDPRIETLIGLTFDDDPAKAAEYYARAVRAGEQQAQTHLAAVCDSLSGSAATLEKGAYDDFCS